MCAPRSCTAQMWGQEVVEVPFGTTFAGKKFLKLKPVTFAPISLNLIDTSLLTSDEKTWLNEYHKECSEKLYNLLEDDADKAWLIENTKPV